MASHNWSHDQDQENEHMQRELAVCQFPLHI